MLKDFGNRFLYLIGGALGVLIGGYFIKQLWASDLILPSGLKFFPYLLFFAGLGAIAVGLSKNMKKTSAEEDVQPGSKPGKEEDVKQTL